MGATGLRRSRRSERKASAYDVGEALRRVWTGSFADGTAAALCSDWKSASADEHGTYGFAGGGASLRIRAGETKDCARRLRLFCISQ